MYAISRVADCPIVACETHGALTLKPCDRHGLRPKIVRAVCFGVLAPRGFELAFSVRGTLPLILQVFNVSYLFIHWHESEKGGLR